MNDNFHVAIITPVIHYTMGGLKVDEKTHVLGSKGPIRGLYASGEVMGGVHGKNRLGGNSLLDCVVYGRVAGRVSQAELDSITDNKIGRLNAVAG
jgi:succinate dehydrogenase/fumarate reductase flavoprotein subunit